MMDFRMQVHFWGAEGDSQEYDLFAFDLVAWMWTAHDRFFARRMSRCLYDVHMPMVVSQRKYEKASLM